MQIVCNVRRAVLASARVCDYANHSVGYGAYVVFYPFRVFPRQIEISHTYE